MPQYGNGGGTVGDLEGVARVENVKQRLGPGVVYLNGEGVGRGGVARVLVGVAEVGNGCPATCRPRDEGAKDYGGIGARVLIVCRPLAHEDLKRGRIQDARTIQELNDPSRPSRHGLPSLLGRRRLAIGYRGVV